MLTTKYLFELLERYQLEQPVYHISKLPGSKGIRYFCTCEIPDFFIETSARAAEPGLAKLLATHQACQQMNDLHLLPEQLPCPAIHLVSAA